MGMCVSVGVYAQRDCRVCFVEEKFDCRRLRTKESAVEAAAAVKEDVRQCRCIAKDSIVVAWNGGHGGARKGRLVDDRQEGKEDEGHLTLSGMTRAG